MEDRARLWVIEKVAEDDLASTSLEVALLDLNMLICFEGPVSRWSTAGPASRTHAPLTGRLEYETV